MVVEDGKSVCILQTDGSGRVKFDFEALKTVLAKVGDRPVSIFSINGAARTGKSFLLSNIFGCLSRGLDPNWLEKVTLDAFPWRNGTEVETKGIRISTEVLSTNRYGKNIALLLMDTEGSFGKDSDTNENAIIFAVSSILSSVMVFNVIRKIDEATLQFLQLFCGFANTAKSQSRDETEKSIFQKLIFLVRDFDCVRQYKFGYYSDNVVPESQIENYKTKEIDPSPTQHPEVMKTRENLQRWFRAIGVYLLPEPGKKLKREDSIEDMDQEFEDYLFKFMKYLVSEENLLIKEVHGKEVTGTELLKSVSFLQELFNGNSLPTVEGIFASAEKLQYKIEKAAAFDQMFSMISPTTTPSTEEIEIYRQSTLEYFQSASRLQNKDWITKFETDLFLITTILNIKNNYKEGIKLLKQLELKCKIAGGLGKVAVYTGTIAGASVVGLAGIFAVTDENFAADVKENASGFGILSSIPWLVGQAVNLTTNATKKIITLPNQWEIEKNQASRMELLKMVFKKFDENLFAAFETEFMAKLVENGFGKLSLEGSGEATRSRSLDSTKSTADAILIVDGVVNSIGCTLSPPGKELVERIGEGMSAFFQVNEIIALAGQWTSSQSITENIQHLVKQCENEIAAWGALSRLFEK